MVVSFAVHILQLLLYDIFCCCAWTAEVALTGGYEIDSYNIYSAKHRSSVGNSSSCCGRFWNLCKVHSPTATEVCAYCCRTDSEHWPIRGNIAKKTVAFTNYSCHHHIARSLISDAAIWYTDIWHFKWLHIIYFVVCDWRCHLSKITRFLWSLCKFLYVRK